MWNAVAQCIPGQGSLCSTTVPMAAFMAIDKLHWLPIHSMMLSQCCLLTVDHTTGVKNILCRLLRQSMSGTHCDTLGL